jgi:hypothetical protein
MGDVFKPKDLLIVVAIVVLVVALPLWLVLGLSKSMDIEHARKMAASAYINGHRQELVRCAQSVYSTSGDLFTSKDLNDNERYQKYTEASDNAGIFCRARMIKAIIDLSPIKESTAVLSKMRDDLDSFNKEMNGFYPEAVWLNKKSDKYQNQITKILPLAADFSKKVGSGLRELDDLAIKQFTGE